MANDYGKLLEFFADTVKVEVWESNDDGADVVYVDNLVDQEETSVRVYVFDRLVYSSDNDDNSVFVVREDSIPVAYYLDEASAIAHCQFFPECSYTRVGRLTPNNLKEMITSEMAEDEVCTDHE